MNTEPQFIPLAAHNPNSYENFVASRVVLPEAASWTMTDDETPPEGVNVLCFLSPLGYYTAWLVGDSWRTSCTSRRDMWVMGYLPAPRPERWMRIPE
jgi:hypothetical protein